MHIAHSLDIIWNSQETLNRAVIALDYAGAVDVAAGLLLLVIWLRNREHSDRRLGLLAILATTLAGILWVADTKFSHRLTVLQTKISEQRTSSAEARVIELKAAIPARTISPQQRDEFISVLLNPGNTSPKIPVKVIVGATDPETEDFAREFRKLLNEAGYGANDQDIKRVPDAFIYPPSMHDRKLPPVVALFSSQTRDIPNPAMPAGNLTICSNGPAGPIVFYKSPITARAFGSVIMLEASTNTLASGDKSHPQAYRYTENPNDILYGICSVLDFIGIPQGEASGFQLLQPGEVGFFIPKQVN